MEAGGALYIVGVLFLFVLAVLWFFLPFAIFGTQPKLDKMLAETQKTNALLTEIRALLVKTK